MRKPSMNRIPLWIAAISLGFSYGCMSNPTSLSNMAWLALNQSGLLVEKGDIFTTSYNEGYNLNFEISETQAASLLPPDFTPLAISIIETDTPRYYLSWYMAVLDSSGLAPTVNRIDLFTYATDPEGELALHFVSSYISMPKSLIALGRECPNVG